MSLRYSIYRVLGNDLQPRHAATQTIDNLKFILENEVLEDADVEKTFVLNRIIDYELEARLSEMIIQEGYGVICESFVPSFYAQLETIQEKQHYLTNVNSARNLCLLDGRAKGFDYILPLDGGSFFNKRGWSSFETQVRATRDPFYAIAQWRVENYQDPLDPQVPPQTKEVYKFPGGKEIVGVREYTLAFGQEADCNFNENLLYGNVDKVELLWRLGLHGIWDRWDEKLRNSVLLNRKSAYYGLVKQAGYVCRLPSGNNAADKDNMVRGRLRSEGLDILVKKANKIVS